MALTWAVPGLFLVHLVFALLLFWNPPLIMLWLICAFKNLKYLTSLSRTPRVITQARLEL